LSPPINASAMMIRFKAEFSEAKRYNHLLPHLSFVVCAPVISVYRALSQEGIRISHPYGLRHWREAISSGPWLDLSPRKSLVPDCVHMKRRSSLWFPADRQGPTSSGSQPGRILKRVRRQVHFLDGAAANQVLWF
jgi:hypothetical protein